MPNYFKSNKEFSGYGQLAQHVIFAYHMVRQTPLIALPPLRFPGLTSSRPLSFSWLSVSVGLNIVIKSVVFSRIASDSKMDSCVMLNKVHQF